MSENKARFPFLKDGVALVLLGVLMLLVGFYVPSLSVCVFGGAFFVVSGFIVPFRAYWKLRKCRKPL